MKPVILIKNTLSVLLCLFIFQLNTTQAQTYQPGEKVEVFYEREWYSGGAWKIIPVGKGYYRITNMWLNDKSLDIINDGENNKIQVAKTGSYSGQMWKITKIQ